MCRQHRGGLRGALGELTWAAEFHPFLLQPLSLSFCLSLPSIWQNPFPPIPPVALPHTLAIETASHTHTHVHAYARTNTRTHTDRHKPTLACTSIPRPRSRVLFTVRLRPTALQDERPSPPSLSLSPFLPASLRPFHLMPRC